MEFQNGITVSAEPLTISGAGAAGTTGALDSFSGTNSYGGLITLGASATISSDAGSTFNVTNAGTITGSGFTLTLAGAGNGSLASLIGTGAGGLTKSGTGTWTVSAANTFTGITTISGGVLSVNNIQSLNSAAQPLGENAAITFSGGTLQYTGSTAATLNKIIGNGNGAASPIIDASGSSSAPP